MPRTQHKREREGKTRRSNMDSNRGETGCVREEAEEKEIRGTGHVLAGTGHCARKTTQVP